MLVAIDEDQPEQGALLHDRSADNRSAPVRSLGQRIRVATDQWSGTNVSMFWVEKFFVLHRFLQLQGVLLIMSLSYPWPPEWYANATWILVVNADLATLARIGKDSSVSVLVLTMVVSMLPIVAILITVWFHRLVSRRGDTFIVGVTLVDRVMMNLARVSLIPIGIVLYAQLRCSKHDVLLLSGTVQCWSIDHGLILTPTAMSFLVTTLVVPVMLRRYAKESVVYHNWKLHERYIRSKEIEQLMGITNVYQLSHFEWVSSYTRPWARYHIYEHWQSVILLVNLIVLSPEMANKPVAQSIVFGAAILLPTAVRVAYQQHRCSTTEHLTNILDIAWVFDCLLAVSTAAKTRNALLVADTLTTVLSRCNGLALGLFLVYLCVLRWRSQRHRKWATWPTTPSDLTEIYRDHPNWITALLAAKNLMNQCDQLPDQLLPSSDLLQITLQLNNMKNDARSLDHVLQWTLYDTTENMARLCERAKARSLLPNPFLQSQITGLGTIMDQRNADCIMMDQSIVSFLNKLLVVRAVVGDAFINGGRSMNLNHDSFDDDDDIEDLPSADEMTGDERDDATNVKDDISARASHRSPGRAIAIDRMERELHSYSDEGSIGRTT